MADIFTDCYECGKGCINDQFCPESNISLPNVLNIKIIANSGFWGFDDGSGNVLISGRAVFNKGHYDFFDGFDLLHEATKTCNGITTGPFKDEQRPDVFYRSVYDPEDTSLVQYGGKKHYGSDGTRDDIERGGMEAYLIDRQSGQLLGVSSDEKSCDETDPRKVYKKVPENFGFANKISATDTIYKNITGAWRFSTYSGCYDSYSTRVDCPQCEDEKQQVSPLNPLDQILPSGYKKDCLPDGSVPRRYAGDIIKVYRNSGVEGFIKAQIVYHSGHYYSCDGVINSSGSGQASSIFNGSLVGINNTILKGNFAALNVQHTATYSEFDIAGTFGGGLVEESGGSWTLFNSYDPKSCCGGKAYNISDTYKFPLSVTNYHADFGRIFNNSKNIRQSNRFPENRFTYDLNTVTPGVASGVKRKDHTYISIVGDGSGLTSGNYPVFERELSYYGPFFRVDKCDYAVRRDERQNTTKGNNYTCYSSKATLEVYPECFSQWSNEYENCEEIDVVKSQQVPRLSFVYRGCNFEDPCSYYESGRPYLAPSSIQDLRRGLAGQEIYMYINLGSVWTTMHNQPECSCDNDPPGKEDPQFVSVPSPVTFPSFPKFDLQPTGYGCGDVVWQVESIKKCDPQADYGIGCDIPSDVYACKVRQPYTTYGFIRNLCGKSTDDKRLVIVDSFSNLIQSGNFRNTNNSGVNEPMYWEFQNPYIHESGGTELRLKGSGDYAFWGLAETNGRLVAPHYRTTVASGVRKCGTPPPSYQYLNFDMCATWQSGWPTDETPFLIEIDHRDDCVGCASLIMENKNLHIDLESMDVKFSHNRQGNYSFNMYGWNHCRYHGRSYDPSYTCESGFSAPCSGNSLFAYDGQYKDEIAAAREPHVGGTCGCISSGDPSFTMYPVTVSGSTIPLGWRTKGVSRNSFVRLSGCDQGDEVNIFQPDYRKPQFGFSVYGSFKLACNNSIFPYVQPTPSGFNSEYTSLWTNGNSPLHILYGGGGCSQHYPSAASDMKLEATFVAIPTGFGYEDLFELMPDHLINAGLESIDTPLAAAKMIAESLEYGPVYRLEYGCSGYDAYGNSGSNFFVGDCYQCTQSGPGNEICECADISCDNCGVITGVYGEPASYIPPEYQNICGCNCNLQLMRKYLIDCDLSETLVEQYDNTSCSGSIAAFQFSGENILTPLIYVNDFAFGESAINGVQFAKITTVYGDPACQWHTGPNAIASGIFYEFEEPKRERSGTTKCSLTPSQCGGNCEDDPDAHAGACGDPIPWTGVPPESGVLVNKRACFPEIMIVNKIECSGDNYLLHVSREYHSHDRQWYYIKNIGNPPVPTCCPKQIGSYSGVSDCVEIPFCTPTDTVTPAYPTYMLPSGSGAYSAHIDVGVSGNRGLCSAHYSSGQFANQDFLLNYNSVAGGPLWNYFNLFYSGNYPTSNYINAIYIDDNCSYDCSSGVLGTVYESSPIFDVNSTGLKLLEYPVGRSGVDWTNRFHSCLQDHTECGSDIYCNKMFFPRRVYASGTKITRFGPLQLCPSRYDRKMGDWYTGYQDFDENPSVIDELLDTKFVDACDSKNRAILQSGIEIDSVTLVVDDYLPLTTFGTGLFTYTHSLKSCTIVGTGCHILPTHNNFSVNAMYGGSKVYPTNNSDTMGYYLDKLTYNDIDNCLFKPFKILVDVECCSSVIRNKNQVTDQPTNLEYIIDNVPSWGCDGFIKGIPCDCYNSDCVYGSVFDPETDEILPPTLPSVKKKICIDVYVPGALSGLLPLGATDYISTTKESGYGDWPDIDCPCSGDPNVEGYPSVPAPSYELKWVYNPEILENPGYITVNEDACPPDNTCTPIAIPIMSGRQFVECNGVAFGGLKKTIVAFQCDNGYIYVPDIPVDSGCCGSISICETLENGFKIDPTQCYIASGGGASDYLDDFLHCGCSESITWNDCQDSIIKAVITEEE